MAIKKSDLYSSLWKSCDELRGGMDASQYKDYILTLLFLKYVSDKAETDPDSLIEIPEGASFEDIAALKGNKDIGERIDKIIGRIAEANDLRGVIDVAFFNDDEKLGKGKEMVDRLSKLIAIFEGLDFSATRAEGDDLLGDAYEYLMRHFATESGKSKGQFYTPAEVSRVLAKVVGIGADAKQDQTIYDPTCGSGSLLMKAADEAPHGLSIYGQEKDGATWALARMNMILHGYVTAELIKGDVISAPGFTSGNQLKTHDFVVANPPFSTKAWSSGISPEADEYKRFELGVPPAKNGDYAFLLHILKSMKSTGQAAVIMPHGVLFRGNVEATIRRELIKRGYIKGIIGLPPNLFYGTGIPACIVVLDKREAADRNSIFLVDASRGYRKDGNKNRLRAQDIHKIVDVFTRGTELDGYSRDVPRSEIESDENAYNLNIARYIDSAAPEDIQDLDAHLNGGIPDRDLELLSRYWKALPNLRSALFEPARPGYSQLRVKVADVREVVESHADFHAYASLVHQGFVEWWESHSEALLAIGPGSAPRPLIHALSEDLLEQFTDVPLLDRYDVYEVLMTYWAEEMLDDVYLVSVEGWENAARPRGLRQVGKQSNGKPKYEDPDLVIGAGKSASKYKADLVPPSLVMEEYLASDMARLSKLRGELDAATQAVADYVEEHGIEGGLLEEVVNENGQVSKKALNTQIKELGDEPELDEVRDAARHCLSLVADEASAKAAVKEADKQLAEETLKRYEALTEGEIKALVIQAKWRATVERAIGDVAGENIRALEERVSQLGRRYKDTIDALIRQHEELSERAFSHLKAMGQERRT